MQRKTALQYTFYCCIYVNALLFLNLPANAQDYFRLRRVYLPILPQKLFMIWHHRLPTPKMSIRQKPSRPLFFLQAAKRLDKKAIYTLPDLYKTHSDSIRLQ